MEQYVKSFRELSKTYLEEIERIQASTEHVQVKSMTMNELRRWYDRQFAYLSAHGEQFVNKE